MTTDPRVLRLDIGGTNIKLASDDGSYVQTKPFPMWTRHQELATVVEGMIGEYVAHCKSKHAYAVIDAIAVTMTGELADCFSSTQSEDQSAPPSKRQPAIEFPFTFMAPTAHGERPRKQVRTGIHWPPLTGMPWQISVGN